MNYPQLERAIEVIAKLRHPQNGCPWDLKQTHTSLLKFLIEEAYEFVHAAESEDSTHMEEELGDLLLQVLLHSQVGKDNGNFDIESVARTLADKMELRHPHVFGDVDANITSEQVKDNWQTIKRAEKGITTKIDDGVLNFPALFSANKIGEKTNRFGFDWPGPSEVEEVVREEWEEFKAELDCKTPDQSKIKEEFGDFLFSVAQLGRHLNINPEIALKHANEKFLRRFHHMERLIENDSKSIDDMNQTEMDIYWKKVKETEKL
ncbi:MAG: nucleoside triphosphate pyrophosphohydrolase [Bacteriovoracaceae bacterium]|nr:nucleoside triphosphate pyrophosphohydrolase [Bacteriovoracaceae bacterium]